MDERPCVTWPKHSEANRKTKYLREVDSILRTVNDLPTRNTKDDCLLVLDHSIYHQQEDYELEIEAPSTQKAENMLQEILTTYQIERRRIESKIKRFFSAKQSDSQ